MTRNDAVHPQSRQHARQRDLLSTTSDRAGLNLAGRQWDNAITPGSQPERHVHTQRERSPRKCKSAHQTPLKRPHRPENPHIPDQRRMAGGLVCDAASTASTRLLAAVGLAVAGVT